MSPSITDRMRLKPSSTSPPFKKCILLESDPELDFVKEYFNLSKPLGKAIRRVYCIENRDSMESFEKALALLKQNFGHGIEGEANFQVNVRPLWYITHFANRSENEIFFTNSASRAFEISSTSSSHLVLAWVIVREQLLLSNEITSQHNQIDHLFSIRQQAVSDEFVIFHEAEAFTQFWLELTQENYDSFYSFSDIMDLAEEGKLDQVKILVEKDRSAIGKKTGQGETLAYAALSGNQLPLLEWLYSENPSIIQAKRSDGRSLLFLAVLGGRKEILDFLLSKKLTYSLSEFSREAKKFGYENNQINKALRSVGWHAWKIPLEEPHFCGRKDELEEIQEKFSSYHSQSLKTVALIGPQGIGKSTLAAAYIHDSLNQNRYSLICWIEAKKSPQSGLKDLGIKLGLASTYSSEEEALKSIVSYLEENPGWLLIFDHCQPFDVRSFIPSLEKGNILITSSYDYWMNKIDVKNFSPNDSLSLLRKYNEDSSPDKCLTALAGTLNHLPLALAQAGEFTAKAKVSYELYLKFYREVQACLESDLNNFDYVQPIVKEIVENYTHLQDQEKQIEILEGNFEKLTDFNAKRLEPWRCPQVISHQGPFTTLDVEKMEKGLLSIGLESYFQKINHPKNFTEIKSEIFKRSPEDLIKSLSYLAEAYRHQGNFSQTTRCLLQICEICKTQLASQNSLIIWRENLANGLNKLAKVYYEQGKLIQAIWYLNQASIQEIEGPLKTENLKNLGRAYRDLGRFSEAIESLEKALQLHGDEVDSPEKAKTLNDLGRVYHDQGDFEKANRYYNEALDIYQRISGNENSSPDAAEVLNNLGRVYLDQGNFKEAFNKLNQALQTRMNAYGNWHQNVANSLDNLGEAYRKEGSLDNATTHLEEALKIRKKIYGEGHLTLAETFNNLGKVYRDQGNFDQAGYFLNKAFNIRVKTYGEQHQAVADSLNSLGKLYYDKGDLDKSIEHLKDALEIREKTLGKRHPLLADSLNNLGMAYSANGDVDKAIHFLQKASEIYKEKDKEKSPPILLTA